MKDLIERDFGIMTGKKHSQIIPMCSPDILKSKNITYFLNPKNAETFPQLMKRASKVIEKISRVDKKGNILIVTHGDIGKMIYSAFYKLNWKDTLKNFYFGNADLLLLSEKSPPKETHVFEITKEETNAQQIDLEKNIEEIIEEYQRTLLPTIKKYIKNKTLLDIGCGNGLNSFLFNKKFGSKITLLDIEDIRSKKLQDFPFFKSSIEKMPFKQKSFDVVFLQYVLHHLPPKIDINKVMLELKRIGKTIIIIEEIITSKTDIQKAKKFDAAMNKIIHPRSKYLNIYKYYSDEELRRIFKSLNLNLVETKILDKGSKKDGFLQRKIYILN